MAKRISDSTDSIALLLLRIPLGVIFIAHGSQMLLGLFGGAGLTATLKYFENSLGIHPVFTLLAIIAEFGGGIGILIGFLTRFSAFGIAATMTVAIVKVHWAHGFFLSSSRGHGIEYCLALLGMALALVVTGGGSWSFDRIILKR